MAEVPAIAVIAALAVVVAVVVAYRKIAATGPTLHPNVHVEPVGEKFDIKTAEPIVHYPFKPVFKTTMNVSRCTHEEWLMADKTYPRHTEIHAQIIKEHPDETCVMNDSKETFAAVRELYAFVLTTHLQKYPQIFSLRGTSVYNNVRKVALPLGQEAAKLSPRQLMQLLLENGQEDFQLLQYDEDSGEYFLRAAGGTAATNFK